MEFSGHSNVSKSPIRSNCVMLSTEDGELHACCKSSSEFSSWMDAIQTAVLIAKRKEIDEKAKDGPSLVYAMFKIGDDLRQDSIVTQMLQLFDYLWLRDGMDLPMTPYATTATWNDGGVVQIVPDATTFANIQHEYGGKLGALRVSPLSQVRVMMLIIIMLWHSWTGGGGVIYQM